MIITKREILEKCKHNKNLCKEVVFKKNFPEAYSSIMCMCFPDDFTFQQKLYHWVNDINDLPTCKVCGNKVKFLNFVFGYREHCSNSCSRNDKQVQEKARATCFEKYGNANYNNREKFSKTIKDVYDLRGDEIISKVKQTKLERYGNENYRNDEQIKNTCLELYGTDRYTKTNEFVEKVKQTKFERYGDENYTNLEKMKETMNMRYGVSCPFEIDEVKEKVRQTNLERYGVENVFQSNNIQEKIKQTNLEKYGVDNVSKSFVIKEKIRQTNNERYGAEYATQSNVIKEKIKQTNLEKYGVEWCCMREEARSYSNDSKPNLDFAKKLDENHITFEREFPVAKYSYDFKIGSTLVEINPTITHNGLFGIFGKDGKDIHYHLNKSLVAIDNGYTCIHVWDWDSQDKIVNMVKSKEIIYARKLELKTINSYVVNEFLNSYHLQGTCKGQVVCLGLYMDGTLVEVMTFGKPRYNKNYEWELLRLCTHCDYKVVGGAEKLFKHFVETSNPKSIISYCDNSKFNGTVYERLGFEKKSISKPTKHWYNLKTKNHITDNFLRQRGFDQLFGTDYGKGTSNEELMIEYGFLPVYDCGQSTYVWTI